jgi:hypothetical protein
MGIRVVPLSKLSPEEKYKKDHAKWLASEPKKTFKSKPKEKKPLVKTISLSSGGQIGNFNGDEFVSSYYELIE